MIASRQSPSMQRLMAQYNINEKNDSSTTASSPKPAAPNRKAPSRLVQNGPSVASSPKPAAPTRKAPSTPVQKGSPVAISPKPAMPNRKPPSRPVQNRPSVASSPKRMTHKKASAPLIQNVVATHRSPSTSGTCEGTRQSPTFARLFNFVAVQPGISKDRLSSTHDKKQHETSSVLKSVTNNPDTRLMASVDTVESKDEELRISTPQRSATVLNSVSGDNSESDSEVRFESSFMRRLCKSLEEKPATNTPDKLVFNNDDSFRELLGLDSDSDVIDDMVFDKNEVLPGNISDCDSEADFDLVESFTRFNN